MGGLDVKSGMVLEERSLYLFKLVNSLIFESNRISEFT